MDLYLQGEVVKAWIRIKNTRREIWDGLGKVKTIGHRRALQNLTKTFPIPDRVWDVMPDFAKWDRLFQVNTDFQQGTPSYSTVKCFVDGVKLQGLAGAGFCIEVNGHVMRQKSIPLGQITTAYQATLTAILRAAEALVPFAGEGPITMFSSSQPAILALNSPTIVSKLTLATNVELDNLAFVSKHSVKLAWAKAQSRRSGLGMASSLAKQGAKQTMTWWYRPVKVK